MKQLLNTVGIILAFGGIFIIFGFYVGGIFIAPFAAAMNVDGRWWLYAIWMAASYSSALWIKLTSPYAGWSSRWDDYRG